MWSSGIITTKGTALLARAAAGETLVIDGARSGTGTGTTITGNVHTHSITGCACKRSGIEIAIQITPEGDAYHATQIGVYGRIGNETSSLIAVYRDSEGISVPAAAAMPDFVITFFAFIYMSQDAASKVYITIDSAALCKKSQLTAAISELTGSLDTQKARIDALIAGGAQLSLIHI